MPKTQCVVIPRMGCVEYTYLRHNVLLGDTNLIFRITDPPTLILDKSK